MAAFSRMNMGHFTHQPEKRCRDYHARFPTIAPRARGRRGRRLGPKCAKAVAVIGVLIARTRFTRLGKRMGLLRFLSRSRGDGRSRPGTKPARAGLEYARFARRGPRGGHPARPPGGAKEPEVRKKRWPRSRKADRMVGPSGSTGGERRNPTCTNGSHSTGPQEEKGS